MNQEGLGKAQVIRELEMLGADDLKNDGRAFAFSYDAGEDIRQVAREAMGRFMGVNGLDPTAYPSAQRIERDLVRTCALHLGGHAQTRGTCTAGGTESVLLAVKAARDAFRSRGHAQRDEICVPTTGHASFHKAAQLFGMRVIPVAVDPESFEADLGDLESKISSRTALIVGSAPGYSHGVIDPITEIGRLALSAGVFLHVDACIGGWFLPFLRGMGIDAPAFDLSVPGVTSLSVDLHKYAFAPKGTSVLLHGDQGSFEHQSYSCADWTGYPIVNPTLLGSRPVAPHAAAWAVIRFLGKAGYQRLVGEIWKATTDLIRTLENHPVIRVLGSPNMGLVAIATRDPRVDIFELSDRLNRKGWHVQPTPSFDASPRHIHLIIDPGNSARMPEFISDLTDAAATLKPQDDLSQPFLTHVTTLLRGSAQDQQELLVDLGVSGGGLPTDRGPLMHLLDNLDSRDRSLALLLFMRELAARPVS